MAFQTVENTVCMPPSTVVKNPLIAVHTVVATLWMPERMPLKKLLIPFHTPSKKDLIPVQTSSQLVPNHPSTVSTSPVIRFSAAERMPVMPSQMPPNISLIPVQHCSQFPVNNPINTSKSPVMTSRTVPRTVDITENAASNTGASRLQKPSHRAFSTSTMLSKSNPRAFSRSVIPAQNSCTLETMPSQIAVIASRNSSLVSHRCLNAATSVAMTATTASTGPATAAMALPMLVMLPVPPATFTPSCAMPFARLEKPVMAEPTVEVSFPIMTSMGPRAAASAATFTMVSFCASDRLFSQSTKDCTFATIFLMTGSSISPIEMASPSSADFRIVS